MQAECSDFSWLYCPAIFAAILIVIETSFGIIYRFRYNILYIWYKIRAKGKEERIKHIKFKFDAFVAYNQEDYKFVREKLYRILQEETNEFNICFHYKHFIVGATIVDNILDAIDTSRHTILIVSNRSLRSEWWQFEVNMAHQASMERKRDIIICVFLEEIEESLLPTSVARTLKIFTCIKWSNTDMGEKIFWTKLKDALNRYKKHEI